jgi:alanyl-tRNA synthetase
MTVRELREKFRRFFEGKGHRAFPSGSLVPYDVTGRLDESLLFNGAGMIQFKPYFRGVAQPEHPRLITCQKCVRTGDIDEVGDATHLTFFEMLGNFSFGDYFKTEAVAYSWEFLTSAEWLNLDPAWLSFTVFEHDEEAESAWRSHGAERVYRLGEETNYWPAGAYSHGPPGPCGPNSEMFYWTGPEPPPGPDYDRDEWLRDEARGYWVEIWNDVFIQYEWQGEPLAKGYRKTGMPELPFRSIDTGMGLERTACVLGGYRTVYDTDAFTPILDVLAGLSEIEGEGRARRIIADHARTATFCIADGVLPSNGGRGYVLRRLIRRAVLQGRRNLRLTDPFLAQVFEGVLGAMAEAYPELLERAETIRTTLRNEEELFSRTLRQGEQLLAEWLDGQTRLSGERAFMLYDTYGFPLEITQELARERGVEVDTEGYEAALAEAQARSRGADERETVYGAVTQAEEKVLADAPEATEFVGYGEVSARARVVRVRAGAVSLDRTPLYAESGGQVGDTGELEGSESTWAVLGTKRAGGIIWHEIEGEPPALGTEVQVTVSGDRRAETQRHHTATHLLHAALRARLGTHVTQAGSYVGPDRLRFDFTHGQALSPEEREAIEHDVMAQILANTPVVTYVDLPIAEARERGAMALFGEKYGERVRMVEIADFSRELCGGTHVRSTGEVGPFRIVSESSAASGIRRIEAVAGWGAYRTGKEESNRLLEVATALKSSPTDVALAAERLHEQWREERRKRERAERALAGGETVSAQETQLGGVKLVRRDFGDADAEVMKSVLDDAAAQDATRVAVGVTRAEGKLLFAVKVGPVALAAGAHAGNLVREVAKAAGGGGGGRAEFATAGGRDVNAADAALAAAEPALAAQLGVQAGS